MAADRMDLCKPERPIPVFIINGTKDPLVPWNGGPIAGKPTGGVVVSVDRTLELWRKLNGCTGEPKQRTLPDKDPNDQTRTTELVWPRCKDGVELKLYRVEGGGHSWHGAVRPVEASRIKRTGAVSRDFSGAEEVWRFFSHHKLPNHLIRTP
jgi:polyhydroxybutyrate depolymerase